MCSFRRFSPVLLFVLIIPTAISSQEETRPALVSMIIISPESQREKKLEDIIKTSILAQLQLDGFVPGKPGASDYTIKTSYEIIGASISILFEVERNRTGEKEIITTARWEGPLSLSLDTEIQRVVHTAITRQMEKTVQVEALEPDNKWSLDLNFARFIPVYELSQTAKLGFGAHLSFGYMVFLEKFLLNPGLKVGLIWIPTTTICPDNPNCSNIKMVPLVAEIKLSYFLHQKFHPYLAGGVGGVWLFSFVHSDNESQAAMVPYVDATLGVDVRLTDLFGIYVESELSNAFEEVNDIISDVKHITGIALNIGIGFRY